MIDDNQQDDNKKLSSSSSSSSSSFTDSHVKRIYRQAGTDEANMLLLKDQDEQRALSVCLQKIKNRKLPMEVVDAEFQWYVRQCCIYNVTRC
jgi:cell fate regulator YaaT (PSP1 superfamily)